MKKILALILAALMSLSLLCACTDTPDNPSVDGSTDSSVQQSTESETDVSSSDTVTDTDDAPTSSEDTEVEDEPEPPQLLGVGDTIRGVVLSVSDNGLEATLAVDEKLYYEKRVVEPVVRIRSAVQVDGVTYPSAVFHAGTSVSATISSVVATASPVRWAVTDLKTIDPVSVLYPYSASQFIPELWEYRVHADYEKNFNDGTLLKDVRETYFGGKRAIYLRLVARDGTALIFARVPNYSAGEPVDLEARYVINQDFDGRSSLRNGDYIKLSYQSYCGVGEVMLFKHLAIISIRAITDDPSTLYYRTEEPAPEEPEGELKFSGTVRSVSKSGRILMDVSGEYRDKIGKQAYVTLCDNYSLEVKVGNHIAVWVQSMKEGKIPEIVASYMTTGGSYYTRYPIPSLSAYTMSPYFPDVSSGEYKGDVQLERHYIQSYDYFHVVKVEQKVIYLRLAGGYEGTDINVAILGEFDHTLKAGDHIAVTAKASYRYYDYYNFFTAYLINASDITEIRVLEDSELDAAYSATWDKPVIYLYPEEDTVCSVKVDLDGELTCTYPDHGTAGWQNFIAKPDGTLIFPDGREYYCLYWEGKGMMDLDLSRGFCVKGSDTAAFLEKILAEIGLTPREANEFIIYWLPLMQNNEYNLISFQHEAYTSAARLEITPTPESLLRVYMVYQPLDAPVEIEPQTFDPFERKGFTVVEWGGGKLS